MFCNLLCFEYSLVLWRSWNGMVHSSPWTSILGCLFDSFHLQIGLNVKAKCLIHIWLILANSSQERMNCKTEINTNNMSPLNFASDIFDRIFQPSVHNLDDIFKYAANKLHLVSYQWHWIMHWTWAWNGLNFPFVHSTWFLQIVAHMKVQQNKSFSELRRDFLSPLVPKIKATFLSSTNMLLVARTPHICIYCAQHICVVFHPYLLPKHVCLCPPSQVTVHLAKNWVGKQKFGSRVYFKPETFQTGKRGENSQNKSNWQGNWNCPHFVTFPVFSSFRYFPHVESGGKRNPAFCPTCPWVPHKGLSGLVNVGASEAELMHPVGLGSRG